MRRRTDGSPEAAPVVPVTYGARVRAIESRTATPLDGGRLEHVHVEVRLPGLPAGFDGLRLGQITDLHFSSRHPFLAPMREWIARQEVDLWAVTGDLYESLAGESELRGLMALLHAPLGVFAVPGNNDNRVFRATGGPEQALTDLGLTVLLNRSTHIERGGDRIRLAGVDDPSRQLDDLSRALEGAVPEEFVLLLAHSPDIIFRAARRAIPFTLTGHTHGGQIRWPLLGVLHAGTRTRGCGPRMAEGALQAGASVVYVSRGTGDSILPFRYRCPGELTTFTLRRGEP